MTNERLKEVAHNAACIHNDVYQWAFFERQMEPADKRDYLNIPLPARSDVSHKVAICIILIAVTVLIVYRLATG